MYRPTSPQSSFFDVDNYCSAELPSSDWSYVYNKRILSLIDEEKFRHFYSESEGRYNCSIKTMISLLIFMGNENDSKQQIDIQKRLIENEFKPEKQYEDAGFVNGFAYMV